MVYTALLVNKRKALLTYLFNPVDVSLLVYPSYIFSAGYVSLFVYQCKSWNIIWLFMMNSKPYMNAIIVFKHMPIIANWLEFTQMCLKE